MIRSSAVLIPLFLFTLNACSDDSEHAALDAATHHDAAQPDRGIPDTVAADLPLGPPTKVKVATFNVHNFFDSEDDPHHSDTVLSAADEAKKIARVGAALRRLDADVVALQEVENRQLLDALVKQELSKSGYDHVHLQPGNDPRGINVAVLSRFPLARITSHANDHFKGLDSSDTKNYRFSRDCLEVEIEPSQNRRLILLVNHLRANDYHDPQLAKRTREAQAKRVREIVDEILKWTPNANLAVVGDLNDQPKSTTLGLIRDGSPALVDPLASQSISQRYTTTYKGDRIQLDYILTAPGLQTDYSSSTAKAIHEQVFSSASDHYPVVATFRVE